MYGIAIPPSVTWLTTADPNIVTYDLFVQICADHANYLLQCGVDPDRIMPVEQFVQPGDLQTYSDVVSWWPKDAPRGYHVPSLSSMLSAMVAPADGAPTTFVQMLEISKARLGPWMAARKINPHDPNESKEDREKRLNRERVARHRIKTAEEPTDDPELAALVREAKVQSDYVTAGRKWLRDVEKHAKTVCDAAILAAKQARLDTVSAAERELAAQIQRAEAAAQIVSEYKARK